MHNFKIGDLALYTSKSIPKSEIVEIVSARKEYPKAITVTNKKIYKNITGHDIYLVGSKINFAQHFELTPLPKSTSWENIKAEIFKPISVIEG